jgi:hypothetical protein
MIIALLFCCFLPFKKNEISGQKWTKSEDYSLTFLLFFAHLWKMGKVGKNGRKEKAIALLFCCFLPIYEK